MSGRQAIKLHTRTHIVPLLFLICIPALDAWDLPPYLVAPFFVLFPFSLYAVPFLHEFINQFRAGLCGGNFLLCAYANNELSQGMLKSKLTALAGYLDEQLEQLPTPVEG